MLGTACPVAFAVTPPPVAPFDEITWEATMKKKLSTGISMGSFRVRFEKTTLDEVRRVASIGDIAHQGDGGESTYWLCYTNVAATRVERVWVMADEMDGPKHYVSHISAELISNGSPTTDCPALPGHMKPLSLDNGFWLQATEGAARKKFGAPSFEKGPWRSYDFQGKVPGKCEGESFDFLSGLLLHINSGRVDRLTVGQTTSC
jgi:hypothetical protein